MVDHVERRFLSFFLVIVLLVFALPTTVFADSSFNDITVVDGKFSVITTGGTSGQKGATVNADGTLKMAVTSVTDSCTGDFKNTANHIVTITNISGERQMLKFSYGNFNNMGSLTIDGVAINQGGTTTKDLAADGTVVINLTSAQNAAETSIVLSGFTTVDPNAKDVTVKPGVNGTVKVNGSAITQDTTVTTDAATGVSVTATPASGYLFLAWEDGNGNLLSTSESYKVLPDDTMTVNARFVPNDTQGYWEAGGKIHSDLNAAITAAQSGNGIVSLLKNATISGTYTIPGDVTVLIPYDAAFSVSGADPVTEEIPKSVSSPTAELFRKLTMADGAKLIVNGAVEVGAKHYASHGGKFFGGTPVSGYGQIQMGSNSSIVVNSGGNLYAWGYITGSGSVTAESGAAIYEKLQVTDYSGGTIAGIIALAGKKILPFNQYYIQNVEVRETLKAGASLICHAGIYADQVNQSSFNFMGSSDSTAMFKLSSGSSVTKYYNAATDQLIIDLNGSVSMNAITLSFAGKDYPTNQYILPINHNLVINIADGASATISQDILLQPGATINVADGGNVTVSEGNYIYVVDADDWGNYCFGKKMIQVTYVASRGQGPVTRSLTDAKVDINGTATVNGTVYTSTAGAQVVSTGKTGQINLVSAPAGNKSVVLSEAAGGYDPKLDNPIDVVPAILTNGEVGEDGKNTTFSTSGKDAGTVIDYCAPCDKWAQMVATVSFAANGGTGMTIDSIELHEGCKVLVPENPFTAPTGMEFVEWNTAEDGSGTAFTVGEPFSDLTGLSGVVTLYAQWEGIEYNVTWQVSAGNSTEVPQKYGEELELPDNPEMEGYEFLGWYTQAGGQGTKIESGTNYETAGDATYYAHWQFEEYTLTLYGNGGLFADNAESISKSVQYSAVPTDFLATEPTREGYNFLGWFTAAEGGEKVTTLTMPANAVNLYAQWEQAGLKGDFDYDNDVDSDDLTLLARHIVAIEEFTDPFLIANADINGDGNVDSDDLTKHARYTVGIITDWNEE